MAEHIGSKDKRISRDAEKDRSGSAAAAAAANTATLSRISNAIKGSEKLDAEGTDLLGLLSHLEGELQARDIAIAALKSEQIKRIVYGCYVEPRPRRRSASPTAALQRDKPVAASDAARLDEEVRLASCTAEAQIISLQNVAEKQRIALQKMANYLRESERRRSAVDKELEEEKAKKKVSVSGTVSEGNDTVIQLENERIQLKQELDAEKQERQKLELALKESSAKSEEEKERQKQIVLILLSDRKKLHKLYLEEKKRSEDLAQMLQEEKKKMETMAVGLEEESKRSLALEAELEKHMSQFGSERQQLRDKLVSDEKRYRDLEEALRKARADVEHFKKQLAEAHRVAMSQAAPPPPYPGNGAVVTGQQSSLSASPTPMAGLGNNRPPPPGQPTYQAYNSYSVAGPVYGSINSVSSVTTNPMNMVSGGSSVSRSLGGQVASNPVRVTASGTGSSSRSVSGFGISHPALIPVGANLSHLDPELMAPDTYSQVMKPSAGMATKSSTLVGPGPGRANKLVTTAGGGGVVGSSNDPAPTASVGMSIVSSSASNSSGLPAAAPSATQPPTVTATSMMTGVSVGGRKPGLGKGVPPPVPPNKPVVPVKGKEMPGGGSKRTTAGGLDGKEGGGMSSDGGIKQGGGLLSGVVVGGQSAAGSAASSVVAGLQGLKFGISLGGGSSAGSGDGSGVGGAKGLKGTLADTSTHGLPVGLGSAVTGKKFFNNIESKS